SRLLPAPRTRRDLQGEPGPAGPLTGDSRLLLMPTTGDVLRTQLRMQADQAMAAAGIGGATSFGLVADDYDADEDGGSPAGHPDPAVAAFPRAALLTRR